MASQSSADNFVESLDIPDTVQSIYVEACELDRPMAESLTIPSDRTSATMLVQGRGREVIARIEELSLKSPNREARRLTQPGIRPAMQVFSASTNIVGNPYQTIIPFYIQGMVTLDGEIVQINRYYHVYGSCRLVIANESKLGAWAYKLGN